MPLYDFPKMLDDYSIPYKEGSRGFIEISCPFCLDGDPKLHGGLNEEGYYTCWRCGHHRLDRIILILTNQEWDSIKQKYETGILKLEKKETPKVTRLELPIGVTGLAIYQKRYLEKRGFDPNYLEHEYDLHAMPWGEWHYHIIIPIYYNNRLVSYIGRDYTDQSWLRYKALHLGEEVIHHKHILYNLDRCPGDHAVVVEGVTDVWRLGAGSIATFGTGYTQEQVNLLSKFKKITVLYDSDAHIKAERLATELSGMGVTVTIASLSEGDPGALSQEEADELMEELTQ